MPDHAALAKVLESEQELNGILFVLFIPSKDEDDKPINDQDIWSRTAAKTFTSLFGGATMMPPAKGMWLNPKTNVIIEEDVVLVHCYAKEHDVNDEGKMKQLAKFLHGMGTQTKQGEVGLVISDVFHRIQKYTLA